MYFQNIDVCVSENWLEQGENIGRAMTGRFLYILDKKC